MTSRKFIHFLILTILTLPISTACNKKDAYNHLEGMIWNTIYHITYKGDPNLRDSIMPVLNEVGSSLSVFDKKSLVSQLNNSNIVETDQHLKRVYLESRRINELSHGNFDPTVSPLIDAWGFGIGHNPTVDTLAIDSILEFVGIQKTRLEDGLLVKEDLRTRFNFSAIAKGYGCDAVGEMFKRNGVNDFMVEIGGELALSGKSPSDTDWRIAIDAPVEDIQPGEETAVILTLTNCGVATSGNYRNYRQDGEYKIAHTISPITGRPFLNEILSATVVAPTCMEADAIATACMAGSLSEAKNIFKETNSEGLLILKDSVWTTPGLSQYLRSLEE